VIEERSTALRCSPLSCFELGSRCGLRPAEAVCTISYVQGACHRAGAFKVHASIHAEWNGKFFLVVQKCSRKRLGVYLELEEEAVSALPLIFHFFSLFSKAL
jgi:hypothetical protein